MIARFQSARWASLAIGAGGLLMIVLWLVYTTVHGPTSFDQRGVVLGRSTLFWGSLLGGPPNLLVALGLILLYPRLTRHADRLAQAGCTLALIGLIVPAGIDLYAGGLGPPLLVPVVGIGLILMAR